MDKKIDILDSKLLQVLRRRLERKLFLKKSGENTPEKTIESKHSLFSKEFHDALSTLVQKEEDRFLSSDIKTLAFQGEHGSYSEMASNGWDSSYVTVPCKDFADVFDGVASGSFDLGIVPVENNLGGVVGQVNQLLIHTSLHVVGAVELPVRHCLVVNPGVDHRDIQLVYSHPQALSQCREFFKRNRLKPRSFYDTAGAARMIFEEKPKGAAAVASVLAAELYHLDIIKEDVQDHDVNNTRFFIISREDQPLRAPNKGSIVFSTSHRAGALYRVLETFAREGLNLTRIESIPYKKGDYAFFIDFEMKKDTNLEGILADVKGMTGHFKYLGSYFEQAL